MHPIKRIIAYSGVSVLFLPLNVAIAWGLTHAGVQYLFATTAGFVAHLTVGFFANRQWTFKKPEIKAGVGLTRSYLVGTVTLLIVLLATTAGIEFLKLEFIWARLLAAVIAGSWDYIVNSIFTFRTRPFR